MTVNTYSVIPEPCKGWGSSPTPCHWERRGEGGTWPQKKGEAKIDLTEFLNDPLLIEGKQVSTLAL